MSLVTKVVDPGAPPFGKQATFTDSDFSANDVLDVVTSLRRGAHKLTITTEADASVSVRINSYKVIYPIRSDALTTVMPIYLPDFTSGGSIINPDAPSYTVSNGEELVLDGPITYVEITALTAGSGVTITAV